MIRSLARRCLYGVKSLRSRLLNPLAPPVLVLVYHRVTTLASDPQLLAVDQNNFRMHMRYLHDHFPVLRFEDDWFNTTEASVVITFDDGYADNFLEALPVIESVAIPATFFVTSGAVGSCEEFWWDELERLILGPGPRPSLCVLGFDKQSYVWKTATDALRMDFYQRLHPLIKKLTVREREVCFRQLRVWAACNHVGRLSHRSLSLDELQGLASSKWVTIGSHGVTHTRLTNLSVEEQYFEIKHSKERLGELCGKEITVFSYPFGEFRDYNRATMNICRKVGFRRVAANFSGQAHSWSDQFQIPRQLVRNWSLDQFTSKLARFFLV